MPAAISIENLSKIYLAPKGQLPIHALKGINLKIPKGSIFGLLGPNGAGKSTLINILAATVKKTSGRVKINGFDLEKDWRAARKSIGVVAQELSFDPFFTPYQTLDIQAGFYGVPAKDCQTDLLLEFVGLTEKAQMPSRSLSGGMHRRLMVAKAMVHRPPILILDEPTAGVDVSLRRKLWKNIKRLNAEGTTIILTTHYLEEAEQLCDEIAIIASGALIAKGSKEELFKLMPEAVAFDLTFDSPLKEDVLNALQAPYSFNSDTNSVRIETGKMPLQKILEHFFSYQYQLTDIKKHQVSFEDLFVKLTEKNI